MCVNGEIDGAGKRGKKTGSFPTMSWWFAKKPLPIGISDFKHASTDYYYIDKTLLIKKLLDKKPMALKYFPNPKTL